MTEHITIRLVGELYDNEVYTIGIAETVDGTGRSLEFSLSDHYDEQDRRLGLDTYDVADEHGAVHGCIEECVLDSSTKQLTLRITADAANKMGWDTEMIFTLEVPDEEITLLRTGLRKVFMNHEPDVLDLR